MQNKTLKCVIYLLNCTIILFFLSQLCCGVLYNIIVQYDCFLNSQEELPKDFFDIMLDLSKKKNIKKKVKAILDAVFLILNPLIFVELKSNPKEKNISQLLLFSLVMNFFKI